MLDTDGIALVYSSGVANRMSKMLKSSGAIALATLLSRLLGLVREIVFAGFFGAGPAKGAFDLAYLIPNLFRRLLGEGALTAAFLPIFKQKEVTEGEAAMWHSANAVISALVVVASGICGVAMVGISVLLAWGPDLSAETRLMFALLRIMFPYMMLVCVAATLMGMLNARGYFFIPALGATVLNVVLIVAVVFFAPAFGEALHLQVFALAWGVLVAGLAQAFFQVPVLYRNGFRYRWVRPWAHPTVREVVRKMLPGIVGVAAFQINMLVTQGLAFTEGATIVASFNYAVRLMEFPQGMFGVSLATFLLPTLSGLAAEKNFTAFRSTLQQGLAYAAFLNIFAAVMALLLAEPIVALLFQRREFDVQDTRNVAIALRCLAPSLVAYIAVNLLSRAFFAMGDVKVPMMISVVCLSLNLLLVLFLLNPFRQAGLGLANSISSMVNVGLLIHALRLKLKHLDFSTLWREVGGMAGAAILAGQVTLVTFLLMRNWLTQDTLAVRFAMVFGPGVAGGAVYLAGTYFLKISPARDLVALLRSRLAKWISR